MEQALLDSLWKKWVWIEWINIYKKYLCTFFIKVHELLRKCPVNGISVVVRDRPFERTITLHKDSAGVMGFQFKNGKITTIVKDSSAARNGVLINHQLLEIDGQNVVGLKDKEITKIINECNKSVTITIMPYFIYDHMTKKWVHFHDVYQFIIPFTKISYTNILLGFRMGGSLLKNLMDHSVPNI